MVGMIVELRTMQRSGEFEEAVRNEIAAILTGTYYTTRHGAHPSDKDEFLRERQFWPDMRFVDVARYRTAGDGVGLAITFTPAANADGGNYGFKIDLAKSLATWSKRIGIRNPSEHPSMFAAELVWYMVAYIGTVDLIAFAADDSGVRWINDGSEIFVKLPQTTGHV
jgi:hypothetical protein